MKAELSKLGVDSEVIEEELQGIDEIEGAYRAGQKKARLLAGLSHQDFRRKMGAYLARRGYNWEVISEVANRLWSEKD